MTHGLVVIYSPPSITDRSLALSVPNTYQRVQKVRKKVQEEPPGGASPSTRGLSLILLFAQLGTTGNHCLNMRQLGQNHLARVSVKISSFGNSGKKLRRHPAVCQRWRVSRENAPCEWSQAKAFTVGFGLKNWLLFVNRFVPFPQFFHCYFV